MNKSNNKNSIGVIIVFLIIIAVILFFVINSLKQVKDNIETTSETTISGQETQENETTTTGNVTTHNTTSEKPTTEDISQKSPEEAIGAFSTLSFYDKELVQRYIDYKTKNPEISYEQAILKVNIGLDEPYYTNVTNVSNPEAITVLANKYSSIGDYAPDDLVKISDENSTRENYLRKEACEHFETLCNDARSEGYEIRGMSAYRSFDRQTAIYDSYVKSSGEQEADTYSARPGFSEHQTGLAVDVMGGDTPYSQFKSTKESTWVNENAYKYGFIVRYPDGKEDITGYIAEAWHLRYVGIDVAKIINDENITFDEYCAKYKV